MKSGSDGPRLGGVGDVDDDDVELAAAAFEGGAGVADFERGSRVVEGARVPLGQVLAAELDEFAVEVGP